MLNGRIDKHLQTTILKHHNCNLWLNIVEVLSFSILVLTIVGRDQKCIFDFMAIFHYSWNLKCHSHLDWSWCFFVFASITHEACTCLAFHYCLPSRVYAYAHSLYTCASSLHHSDQHASPACVNKQKKKWTICTLFVDPVETELSHSSLQRQLFCCDSVPAKCAVMRST